MTPSLELLRAQGIVGPLDEHFARTLARLASEKDESILLAAGLASRQVASGHVCLDLRRLGDEIFLDEEGEVIVFEWPPLDAWLARLRESALVAGEGSGLEAQRPLVLDAVGRLYLERYWQHQRTLAEGIAARCAAGAGDWGLGAGRKGRGEGSDQPPAPSPQPLLGRLFPIDGAPEPAQGSLFTKRREPDWQRVAAIAALESRFCVVSGGPGTGKTFTVVKILALLIQQALANGERAPRILLVAPTGKAAARLRQSIHETKGGLACDDAVRGLIPEEATTIHRCLGSRLGSSTRFRHDRDNPLLADVVLVDEASMVDLALMARLVDALPPQARLILLGDKDQLASVEAGAVLGDICNTGGEREHSHAFAARVAGLTGDALPLGPHAPETSGLWDCVVHLSRSYRYAENSGIGALARAINDGDAERALEILASKAGDVALVETSGAALDPGVLDAAVEGFSTYLGQDDPAEQLVSLDQFRVLCALRRGAHGVEGVNREIEAGLARRGLVDASAGAFYRKRPILITRNDYQVDLYNGDVGVIGAQLAGPPSGGGNEAGNDPRPRRVGDGPPSIAYFPATLAAAREVRALALSRLPPHETVFAMTVHKSQGSEFTHVAIVLPPEMSPVLSRELLYTAVSRAKERVTLFASRDVLRAAISRRVERASGLRDLLWGAPSDRG